MHNPFENAVMCIDPLTIGNQYSTHMSTLETFTLQSSSLSDWTSICGDDGHIWWFLKTEEPPKTSNIDNL